MKTILIPTDFSDNATRAAEYAYLFAKQLKVNIILCNDAESGLNWLCHDGGVDILAMVHRQHNILYTLIKGSHTQKMAGHISKPLLVFSAQA